MQCIVYQLRRDGEKLPKAEVRIDPAGGYLVFEKPGGYPVRHARLLRSRDAADEALPTLMHAHLLKIRGGILLAGLQDAGYQKHHRQTWWVVPGHHDALVITQNDAAIAADK